MKHLNTISRTPAQAISIVEFDGILAVFGRTLTAITNSLNFILNAVGFPEDLAGAKGTEEA